MADVLLQVIRVKMRISRMKNLVASVRFVIKDLPSVINVLTLYYTDDVPTLKKGQLAEVPLRYLEIDSK